MDRSRYAARNEGVVSADTCIAREGGPKACPADRQSMPAARSPRRNRLSARISAAAAASMLVILAAPQPAQAQYFGRNKVHYDRLDFRLLQTEHFDIYYYPEEETATRHAARMA